MRMAAYEFVLECAHDVLNRELRLLRANLGYEKDLQKQITELLFDGPSVGRVYGVHELVSFLENEGPKGLQGLLAVPRAAVWRAKLGHEID
jgi:hypothetical protein